MKNLPRVPLIIAFILVMLLLGVHVLALSYSLYFIFPWLDAVMHMLGGFALACATYSLSVYMAPRATFWQRAFHVGLVILVIGSIWEALEYLIVISTGSNIFYMSWGDTLTDMLANLGGGILGLSMVYYIYEH